jgi:KUP system potassium uptake protein
MTRSHGGGPQDPRGGRLAGLALAALGVVYGDIGTSPLYSLQECFTGDHAFAPTPENVYGVVSLVLWTLIVVVTVKYHLYVLRADNHGEGGILALMALVRGKLKGRRSRALFVTLGLFGAALLYGDGAITPAISVLSAVEGLEIEAPAAARYVLPITVAILLALFMIQRRGTGRIGRVFGPVMLVWFLTVAVLGIGGVLRHPAILGAINPVHALRFFAHHGLFGLLVLGGVFLVATGGEALYADMGQFGERPIQIDWFSLVGLSLVLNYLGQGAVLLHDPQAVARPFYSLAPSWALLPLVILATAATVIASQAIISGAFSLTHQAVQLGYMPHMETCHTSPDEPGQIYLPAVNMVLAVATIGLVLAFGSSHNLAAAYGIAVSLTMLITTLLAAIVARLIWRWSPLRVAAITGLFLIFDLAFAVANMAKFADGGWFPLLAGLAVFSLMASWRRGREVLTAKVDCEAFEEFVASPEIQAVPRVEGTAVFLSRRSVTPNALRLNLKHNHVLHERVVLLAISLEDVPVIADDERTRVEPLGKGFFRALVRYGFQQYPGIVDMFDQVRLHGLDLDMETTTFFIGREMLVPDRRHFWRQWRERLFSIMARLALRPTDFLHIPVDRVVEIWEQIEI